jgi:hypothetical protein
MRLVASCALLYAAGELFACRRCHGLAYTSQQESRAFVKLGDPGKLGRGSAGAPICVSRFRKAEANALADLSSPAPPA